MSLNFQKSVQFTLWLLFPVSLFSKLCLPKYRLPRGLDFYRHKAFKRWQRRWCHGILGKKLFFSKSGLTNKINLPVLKFKIKTRQSNFSINRFCRSQGSYLHDDGTAVKPRYTQIFLMSHGQAFHCRGSCRDPAPWRGDVGRVAGSLWELWALSCWHSWAIKRGDQFITILRASHGLGSAHSPLALFRAEAQLSLPFVTTIKQMNFVELHGFLAATTFYIIEFYIIECPHRLLSLPDYNPWFKGMAVTLHWMTLTLNLRSKSQNLEKAQRFKRIVQRTCSFLPAYIHQDIIHLCKSITHFFLQSVLTYITIFDASE